MGKPKHRGHKGAAHKRKDRRLAAQLKNKRLHAKRRDIDSADGDDADEGTILLNGNNGNRGLSDVVPRGRGDSGAILTDPKRLDADLRLVRMALARGYNVRRKTMLRRRLEAIAAKLEVNVPTKEGGMVPSEALADKHSIDAIKALIAMDQADMKRVELFRGDNAQGTTVNVNVNNAESVTVDQRTIELARLAHSLGCKEVTVEGKSIAVADLLGTDAPVSEAEDDT